MANPKTASGGGADGRYSGAKSYRAHAEKEEIVKDVDGVVGMDGWLAGSSLSTRRSHRSRVRIGGQVTSRTVSSTIPLSFNRTCELCGASELI